MIAPGIIELMNLVIDGAATGAERARLDEYLSADPDARSYYEALRRLTMRLDEDPTPEPPAALEPRILDAIHQLPVPGPARKEPTPGGLRGFFAPTLRPWATFGLGLATGLVILAVVQYSQPAFWTAARDIDPSYVSGSMTPRDADPVAIIPVEGPGGTVSGSAVVYRQGPEMVVEVKLQTTIPVEWTVSYDEEAWDLGRIERHDSATSAFAANPGSILGLHTGEGRLTLVFTGSPEGAQAVVFKLLQGGQPVFEGRPSVEP